MKINSGRIALLWSIFAFLSLAIANSVVSSIIPYKKEPYIMPEQKTVSPVYYYHKIDEGIFRLEITKEQKAQILANIFGGLDIYIKDLEEEQVRFINNATIQKEGTQYKVKAYTSDKCFLYDVDKWDGTFYIQRTKLGPNTDPVITVEDLPKILVALIIQESQFDPNAHNPYTGASGLTQIIKSRAWEDLRNPPIKGFPFTLDYAKLEYETDIFKVDIARQAGLDYLTLLLTHYLPSFNLPQTLGNLLAAYNWGIGALSGAGGWANARKLKSTPDETKKYVREIRDRLYY